MHFLFVVEAHISVVEECMIAIDLYICCIVLIKIFWETCSCFYCTVYITSQTSTVMK